MNRIIGVVVLVLGIAGIMFGGLGLVALARTTWQSGVEPERIPRYVFTFALCLLFILTGIKAIGFAQRKSAQSSAAARTNPANESANKSAPTARMDELAVTWSRATQVWWSVTWRAFVVSSMAGLMAGVVAMTILVTVGRHDLATPLGNIIGVVVAIPAGIWAIKAVLGKEYRRYRIVLLPSNEARLENVLQSRRLQPSDNELS